MDVRTGRHVSVFVGEKVTEYIGRMPKWLDTDGEGGGEYKLSGYS